MKRIVAVVLLIVLSLTFFTSCGEKTLNVDTDALIEKIVADYKMENGFVFTSSSQNLGEYLDEDLIISYYGDATEYPDFSKISKYCVYVDESDPKLITDVGIFEMGDTEYAETFMKFIKARIDAKIADGLAYSDIDVATLKKAVIKQKANYVYYAVGKDSSDIVKDIESELGK
ncbi:MAG: DUF4358 domain-containing protein [Ruminococcaceae bacterium]|nr:DUF4358 domain-containing protein [Oscillospiraceae bacterium]